MPWDDDPLARPPDPLTARERGRSLRSVSPGRVCRDEVMAVQSPLERAVTLCAATSSAHPMGRIQGSPFPAPKWRNRVQRPRHATGDPAEPAPRWTQMPVPLLLGHLRGLPGLRRLPSSSGHWRTIRTAFHRTDQPERPSISGRGRGPACNMNLRILNISSPSPRSGLRTRCWRTAHIAQSSLSAAVRRLETELGTPLLNGQRATSPSLRLVRNSTSPHLSRTMNSNSSMSIPRSRAKLVLGSSHCLCSGLPRLRVVRARYRAPSIAEHGHRISRNSASAQPDALHRRIVDLAVCWSPEPDDDLRTVTIAQAGFSPS